LSLPEAYVTDNKGTPISFPAQVYLQKALAMEPNNPAINRIAGVFLVQIGTLVGVII
jgi:hypothetical protein